jgi:hypothetical protein
MGSGKFVLKMQQHFPAPEQNRFIHPPCKGLIAQLNSLAHTVQLVTINRITQSRILGMHANFDLSESALRVAIWYKIYTVCSTFIAPGFGGATEARYVNYLVVTRPKMYME